MYELGIHLLFNQHNPGGAGHAPTGHAATPNTKYGCRASPWHGTHTNSLPADLVVGVALSCAAEVGGWGKICLAVAAFRAVRL